MNHAIAILPTRTNINLHEPESNPYYEADLVYHVLKGRSRRTDKTTYRVVSGWGDSPYWELGTRKDFFHDQTSRDFGNLELVGTVVKGKFDGEIPDRKIALSVFK